MMKHMTHRIKISVIWLTTITRLSGYFNTIITFLIELIFIAEEREKKTKRKTIFIILLGILMIMAFLCIEIIFWFMTLEIVTRYDNYAIYSHLLHIEYFWS